MIKAVKTKKQILLVDDDQSVTQMLCMLLETRGYEVNVAATGEEAISRADVQTDLILLDLVLPDQEGFAVCRRLKENKKTKHIPIVILSAKLLAGDIVEGLYLGADDYLTKPFEYEELVARMEAVMRRGALIKPKDSQGSDDEIISELKKIINNSEVTPFFQPIFLLKEKKILGLEALCRPTETTSMLSNPELLFKAAIQFGCYQDLEILSWKKAIAEAGKYLKDEKLFLNCNPYFVEGQKFLSVKSLFDQSIINIENVVLEITERSAISDYKVFFEHLNRYREHGFQFAVDDVGGGYASLESIVETKPEVVKIDRHIVNDLDKDIFKKSIVKFIVAFCKENNIISIAEGIETKEDLESVKKLGVDAAQGYYLYRPTPNVEIDHMLSTIKSL